MSDPGQESPIQEARSLITITAILIAVGCYAGAISNVPTLSQALFWVASTVYHFAPALSSLSGPQVPQLAAAITVGGAIWIIGMPMSGLIAKTLSAGQLASLERQTMRLKRNRVRIQNRRRAKDSFDVS